MPREPMPESTGGLPNSGVETDGIGIQGLTRIRSFPETGSSLARSDGAFTRPGVRFKLLSMATAAAIVNSVRVTVRATPQPVHRVQLATRLAFAAALSEAAPLAVEAFAVAAVVDSAAAEAVEDMAAVAAVSEMERRHNLSSHCPAPTLKNLIS
jgi:hypothetical protein